MGLGIDRGHRPVHDCFRLKEPRLGALAAILDDWAARIYPPEVIKEHGDVSDWRNLVGTGPFMLTDWTKDSSVIWDKNPDYWGTDCPTLTS